jgi:hypothetical protein
LVIALPVFTSTWRASSAETSLVAAVDVGSLAASGCGAVAARASLRVDVM